ncbi:MAG: hypothetical protein WD250_06015 [Egibacteraceae bacterium]
MRVVALVLAGLLLVACGQEPALTPSEDPEEDVPAAEPGDREGTEVLEGTLGGDAQLEGGCVWLEAGDGRYEVVYPDGYQVAFDPVRLLGPEGETVAGEGDTLRVEGQVVEDRVSVCQVGTIFHATAVGTGT